MPRIPKKYINTSFFHIMVQGINKEYIFNCKKDIEKYLEIIKNAKEEVELQIVSYCIMSNHAHLLIYTDDVKKLIKFMHKINLIYAKYYNKKYNRVGYVFRDRYKTQPIFFERHLYYCIDYIHNNPVKAHICDSPSKYKYSSYNQNCFEVKSSINNNIRKYIDSKKFNKEKNEVFIFMEYEENKEQICIKLINEFALENNIEVSKLKNNKHLVINLVKELRKEYKISYRIIEKQIGIGRETLRKIANGSGLK
ncbi:MAG: hypothetical protein HFJ40_01580 [Clostridia bacterium]|nr:hypothetical protein [Clostridia bacterium]